MNPSSYNLDIFPLTYNVSMLKFNALYFICLYNKLSKHKLTYSYVCICRVQLYTYEMKFQKTFIIQFLSIDETKIFQ